MTQVGYMRILQLLWPLIGCDGIFYELFNEYAFEEPRSRGHAGTG